MELSLKLKAILICVIVIVASVGIGLFVFFMQNRSSIRFGALSGDLHHLPLFVALEKNFFQEEGLDIQFDDIRWFPNGNEVMIAFEAGSLDIAYLGMAPAMAHKLSQNAPIKVVSGVNVNGSAIIVKNDTGINNLADLDGKSIAVPSLNNMQDFILQIALESVGLSIDNVTRVTMSVGNMESALNLGQVNAFVAWEPFNAKAIHNIGAKSLKNSSEIWENHPCCVIAAAQPFLDSHQSEIEKIIKVHKRALDWMVQPQNHAELISIAKKYTGIMTDAVIELGIENVGYVFNFTQYLPEIERFYDNLTALNANVPPWPAGRDAFLQEFLNASFLSA
ncbi:MAG: ABC transporter substrate-binding protein [Candidatus Helarchaeota archaeon]